MEKHPAFKQDVTERPFIHLLNTSSAPTYTCVESTPQDLPRD